MSELAAIKQPIHAEFATFERMYAESLQTENGLLSQVYAHLLGTKGKQIRPILALLSAKLCGKITENTHISAMSLELLHTASLIHDDVVDETLQRRGKPSVNGLFGNKIAVLSGDYLLSKVFAYAGNMGDRRLIDAFANLGKSLSEGELLQLQNAHNPQFDEQVYIEVIRKKTAVLFSTCMFTGAVSSTLASAEQIEQLHLFGEYLGICFQIKDDIFDYSDSKEIGKPTANDIREKKITLPLIYAYNHASDEEKAQAKTLLQQNELSANDISFFINLAKEKGGIEYAETVMNSYCEKAKTLLNDFDNEEIKQSLITMLDYVVMRKK